jgi:Tfp pilus assembly protein PilV
VLLISISIAAIVRFQHYLSYSTNSTQQQTDANILAVKQIETLRDFKVLNTTAGYAAYQDIASGTSNATVGNTTYTINWTVTANTNPTYKTIDTTVTWTDRFSTSQTVRLISRVAGLDPVISSLIK